MMKEIAESLRIGADAHIRLHCEDIQAEYLLQLANKVEQMRCETCHWFENYVQDEELAISNTADECTNPEVGIENSGPNFGCWHWKAKGVK